MIPVEIVVTFVIGWLIFKGVSATLHLRAALAKIEVLDAENVELRETVIRLNDGKPLDGPGWTTRKPKSVS